MKIPRTLSSMWLHALVIATVVLQLVNFWVLSQGYLRAAYYMLIVIYTGLMAVEVALATRDPSGQWSVGLYLLVDIWAVSMAIRGLLRLNEKEGSNGR